MSTGIGVAVPPADWISRATVEMVEAGEFGSGGKGVVFGSEVDFAATTTVVEPWLALFLIPYFLPSLCLMYGSRFGYLLLPTCIAFFGKINSDLSSDAPGGTHNERNLLCRL